MTTNGPGIKPPPVTVAYQAPPPESHDDELPVYGHLIIIGFVLAAAFVLALGMSGRFSHEVTDALFKLSRAAAPIVLLVLLGVLRSTRLTTKTGFRALVFWHFGLSVLAGFLAAGFEHQLPSALQTYNQGASGEGWSTAVKVLVFTQLAVLLAAYVGMLALWRPSRYLFLAAIVLGAAFLCFAPPKVDHPVAVAVSTLGDMVAGALLVMLFANSTRPIFQLAHRQAT